MILLILLAQPSPPGDANVALDDERLQDVVPKGLQKVELDLDDALFLEFEEKEEVLVQPPAEALPEPEETPLAPEISTSPAKPGRKKMWILGIAAGLCLLLGAGGAYFFMKSDKTQPEEGEKTTQEPSHSQTPAAQQSTPEQNATPGAPEAAMPEKIYTYSLEQFQVEYVQNDQIRFLTCRFSIPGASEIMRLELQTKSLVIRDGVYRYLKNSSLSFLDNPQNSEKLKSDLATVVNQYMQSGKVSEILLETYVVK
jgi:flagellar FliL protein